MIHIYAPASTGPNLLKRVLITFGIFQGRASKLEPGAKFAPKLVLQRKEWKFGRSEAVLLQRCCFLEKRFIIYQCCSNLFLQLLGHILSEWSHIPLQWDSFLNYHISESSSERLIESQSGVWSPPTHCYPCGSVGWQRSIASERFRASQCHSATEPVLMFPLHLFPWRHRCLRVFFLPSATPQ